MSNIDIEGQMLETGDSQQQTPSGDGKRDFLAELAERDQEIQNLKKMNQGQDRKNSELAQKIQNLEKILSEKDQTKKTVEEQMDEMRRELSARDAREKAKEKEALVNKIIAKHKLDPEYDFDFLNKFETEDLIEEKAQLRAEYYSKLKDDGFRERAGGSVPKKGKNADKDLSKMDIEELNKLAQSEPDMIPAITEAIKQKYRSK